MKRILTALLFTAAAAAQIQVSGIGVLPTGAVLYATGDPAGCTIEVSDTVAFAELAVAVDDTRGGSSACAGGERLSRGNSIEIVIGGPGIVTAADGRKYSKALKPFTTYYYRIRKHGAIAASGAFVTANLPFGNLRTDPPQVDPERPGDYAYPTIDQNAANWKTTDPATGLLYGKLSRAGTRDVAVASNGRFAGAGGGWANPGNALADDGNSAIVNGDANATLFLLHDQTSKPLGVPDYNDRDSLDYYQVTIKASGTASAAENRTIQAALTADRVTAFTPWHEITLTNSEAAYTVGSTTPIDMWQMPGGRALSRPDVARRSGTVNVAGTTVTYAGGQRFNLLWSNGSKIAINGTEYTIASVDHDMQLTLREPAGNQTGAPYVSSNFGVLVRKKTPSADTVGVQYASATYQTSGAMSWPAYGANMCSPLVKTAGDGKQGVNCFIGAGLYFAPLDGGGLRFLGDMLTDSGNGEMAAAAFPCTTFDPRDPDSAWCMWGGWEGRLLLRKGRYRGDHMTHPGITTLPFCAANGNVQPCTEWQNFTPASSGKNILAMAKDYGGYPATYPFPTYCSIAGIQTTPANTAAIAMTCWFLQNSTAVMYVFDAGNEMPLGTAGSTFRVAAYSDTFSRRTQRWAKAHHWPLSDNPADNGWAVLYAHPMDVWPTPAPGFGPYTVTATSVNGVPGANLTSTLAACPSNSLHPELQGHLKCTTVTVDRAAPCDDGPSDLETAMIARNPGLHSGKCGGTGKYYLQDAAVGDFVVAQDDTWEVMELLKIDGASWVLHRGDFYNLWGFGAQAQTFGARNHTSKVLAMTYNLPDFKDPDQGPQHAWNWIGDPYHTSSAIDATRNLKLIDDPGSHRASLRNAIVTVSSCAGYGFYNHCYLSRIGDIVHRFSIHGWDRTLANNPPPFGQKTFGYPNMVDSHPTLAPAQGDGEMFFFDGRPWNGSPWAPSQNGVLVAGQLYKFVAADFATSPGYYALKRKHFDTVAYVGVNPLKDISAAAAGDTIGTGTSDSYKYCYAERANECRTGSVPGDVYVNAPQVRLRGCSFEGIASNSAETRNICIFNNQPHAHRYMQYLLRNDLLGRYSRTLGSGLQFYGLYDSYMNLSTTPDGRYAMFRTAFAGRVRSDAFSVEVPPIETDSVDRSDFVPVSANIMPIAGADNAVVEFGYSKFASRGADANDSPDEFLSCTSRREKCVIAAGTTSENPYYFSGESYSGVACGSGCEVKIPAVSGRVLYYRVLHRAGTRVIATGGLKAVPVP